MSFDLDNLTIIQNFICTQDKRLKMLNEEVPKMSEIFKNSKFVINYNSESYLKEIKSIYTKNVNKKNLLFKNDLHSNFAKTTLSLLTEVDTDYVMFICEDFVYLKGRSHWAAVFKEMQVNNADFCMLAKIEKYTKKEWQNNYTEGNECFFYHSKNAPTNRGVVSIDGIYKKKNLVALLEELRDVKEVILCDGSVSKYVNMPNFFEQYFIDEKGMKSLDWVCCLPKELITYSYHPENQAERPW
tara:strand:- start:6246 stop:6971 length:726 start_codon:yes stop_codon:yes gene_type:complete